MNINDILASSETAHSQSDSIYYPLEKYSYPWYIKIAGLIIVAVSITSFYYLNQNLAYYLKFDAQVKKANELFRDEQYTRALSLYQDLLFMRPKDLYVRLQIIKSYFALSQESERYYQRGLAYIEGTRLTVTQVYELEEILPFKYHSDFRSYFQ